MRAAATRALCSLLLAAAIGAADALEPALALEGEGGRIALKPAKGARSKHALELESAPSKLQSTVAQSSAAIFEEVVAQLDKLNLQHAEQGAHKHKKHKDKGHKKHEDKGGEHREEWWPWHKQGQQQHRAHKAHRPADESKKEPGAAFRGARSGPPSLPGCYMRMPSGCPKQPMQTRAWRHDTWAERKGLDPEDCFHRKHTWNRYCGAEDASMYFVANATDSAPQTELDARHRGKHEKEQAQRDAKTSAAGAGDGAENAPPAWGHHADRDATPEEPGCYVQTPTGCPKQPMRTKSWRHDMWAEQDTVDEEGCKQRKAAWDKFCGRDDSKMLFVPQVALRIQPEAVALRIQPGSKKSSKVPAAGAARLVASNATPAVDEDLPSVPGCYMRMPSGCPSKPMDTRSWKLDTWAESHGLDEAACKRRKATWDRYCQSDDAVLAFVPKL